MQLWESNTEGVYNYVVTLFSGFIVAQIFVIIITNLCERREDVT